MLAFGFAPFQAGTPVPVGAVSEGERAAGAMQPPLENNTVIRHTV